ncbi:ankyrin repeat domain-containing protein [Wolbachia endosymbiont (group A) of Agelastica alni]|uniref:ankyrin repeat domain-containing protein n=1 Tax=Wolbachia endosymbiont (group A) of Agelastica alni TaxID=3066130 RepID=UPI0031330339
MFTAVQDGSLNKVKDLVSRGANLDAKDSSGWTTLYWASFTGRLDISGYLIDRGADINAKDNDGKTPLHCASTSNHLGMVKYLISKDANIDAKDNNGETPLDDASSNSVRIALMQAHLDKELLLTVKSEDDLKTINSLIAQGISKDRHGAYYYAWNGNLDMVKLLVERDVNVNATDKYDCTLLHWAALKGHSGVAEFLVDKGANVNAKDILGRTPMHLAVTNNYMNITEFLLENGANVDEADKNGSTPLHYAARFGQLESARFLIDEKANMNAADNSGKKPVHVAAENNNKNIIDLLLDKRVSVNDADKDGWTLLHWAASKGNFDIVEYLIGKGADIRAKGKDGQTPLCVAIQYDRLDIINFLLNKGTNIEASDFHDDTVLKLSYCIKEFIELCNSNKKDDLSESAKKEMMQMCSVEQKSHFEELKNKLPESLKNIVFASKVCITNVYFNEYLYAAAGSSALSDSNRRRAVYTWVPSENNNPHGSCGDDEQGMWKIQPHGDYVCITNVNFNEYLYAADGSSALSDSNRRRAVYTWVPSKNSNPPGSCNNDKQGMWKVQPYGDYVCITNVNFNEYLYAADGSSALSDSNRRRAVYTWVPSEKNNPPGSCGNDKQGMWKVEDRGSIRNRRDTRELGNEANLDSNFLEVGKGESFNRVKNLAVNQGEHHYYHDHSSHQSPIVDSSNQPRIAASSGTRPSSWINDLCGWVKGSVGGLFYSRAALSEEASNTASSIPQVDEQFAKASVSSSSSSTSTTLPSDGTDKKQENGGFFRDNIDYVNANIKQMRERQTPVKFKPSGVNTILEMGDHYLSQVDFNGTIMLLDLLIRKVTGQKYISTVDQSIFPLEAQGYALNITKEFEKVVEQAGLKSGVSMHRLNIDYMEMQKEITRKVMSGKFNEISGILNSYVEKACPGREAGYPGKLSSKKFDKFMLEFNSRLNVVLDQSIQQILHNIDGTLEVGDAKQMSLEPQSYLSNASVHSHSKVSTCLSEIGVTKLGGNLNR